MTTSTAEVTLRLYGALRDAIGEKEVQLSCAGCTVKDALLQFVDESGGRARRFLFDDQGNQWRSVILLLNDEPVGDSQVAQLQPGDVISLLLPLAGG